ncbi:MAG: GDP-mannose 4,6-dehydratase [Deltaproteobacteria bacterium]|nr:GDP-mannose 4,6-dehydratase [Deltaproteobacteria bacterium]
MRILVTGCAGFIGWKVCEFLLTDGYLLLTDGYQVVGVDNVNDAYDVRLKQWRLEQLEGKPGFKFHRVDICDRDALRAIFRQSSIVSGESTRYNSLQAVTTRSSQPDGPFDAVVNLAARAGVRQSVEISWNCVGSLA